MLYFVTKYNNKVTSYRGISGSGINISYKILLIIFNKLNLKNDQIAFYTTIRTSRCSHEFISILIKLNLNMLQAKKKKIGCNKLYRNYT